MAAVATPTVTFEWFDGKVAHAIGTIVVSNSTYATNGIACSFAGLVKGSQQAPTFIQVQGIAGFVYAISPGTTQANGLFLIFVNNSGATNAALPQHTTATVVAGVQGDTITFHAIFEPFGR